MNPAHFRNYSAMLSACAFSGASVLAQGAAPTPAEARRPQSDVDVVLAPFEVVADARDSYEALNFSSLSGTNRPLNRLPITAEVMGSALIADLGVTDALSLLNQYATGVGVGLASAGSPTLSGFLGGDRAASGATRLRGLASSGIRRNGFLNAGSLVDLYSMERTEVIRGPQSLLYGQGQAGGVTNLESAIRPYVCARAIAHRQRWVPAWSTRRQYQCARRRETDGPRFSSHGRRRSLLARSRDQRPDRGARRSRR